MYIRWIIRKHKNATVADMIFHDAYVVESNRDENNVPRQRTICYLGNIRQFGSTFPSIEREIFFLRAERILAGIPELTEEDRQQILGLLRQKVPELSDSEVIEAFRNNLRWYYRWWQEHGGAPSDQELLALIAAARDEVGPL